MEGLACVAPSTAVQGPSNLIDSSLAHGVGVHLLPLQVEKPRLRGHWRGPAQSSEEASVERRDTGASEKRSSQE